MESFRFFVRLITDAKRVIGKRRHPVVFVSPLENFLEAAP
ncbi:Hypothetical protein RAK1035_3351 [Roseovarius sp. AK1035]|nr:Hypothetical protein RAK1035_3351 [Roseovarius sp. AK1035]